MHVSFLLCQFTVIPSYEQRPQKLVENEQYKELNSSYWAQEWKISSYIYSYKALLDMRVLETGMVFLS